MTGSSGAIVRIAPHYYSIDDPEAIKVIYSHGSKFVKVSRVHSTDQVFRYCRLT